MRFRVEPRITVTMAPWAQCQHCVWKAPAATLTRDMVREHIGATAHEVILVVEKRTLYGPVLHATLGTPMTTTKRGPHPTEPAS